MKSVTANKLQPAKFVGCLLFVFLLFNFCDAQTTDNRLPDWIKNVGARSKPNGKKIFWANHYGAIGDGKSLATKAVQKAIDECAKKGGIVALKSGEYLTGAIFLKSNVNLRIDKGV